MNDIIQIQMSKDNAAVIDKSIPTIDDILARQKNINESKSNINEKKETNKIEEIIKNNEITLKENQKEGANNHKIKKGFKYIFPIILNSLLGLIVFSDFILYLASPRVRIILLYIIKVYYLHLYF